MARIKIACTERTLWDGVKRQLPDMPSPCGGRGSCGACRVRLISGSTQISDADTEHLSKKRLRMEFELPARVFRCRTVKLR